MVWDRWNREQRLVVVAAWGVVLWAFWDWLSAPGRGSGWSSFGPDGVSGPNVIFVFNPGLSLLVKLALAVVWAVSSLWLLANRPRVPATPVGDDAAA